MRLIGHRRQALYAGLGCMACIAARRPLEALDRLLSFNATVRHGSKQIILDCVLMLGLASIPGSLQLHRKFSTARLQSKQKMSTPIITE